MMITFCSHSLARDRAPTNRQATASFQTAFFSASASLELASKNVILNIYQAEVNILSDEDVAG